jgi:dTDP-4-dehydrorhamnose reductase
MNTSQKTLVFGKNGFLGSYLFEHFQSNPNYYFAFRTKDNKLIVGSGNQPTTELPWSDGALIKVINDLRPEIVINAIALANAKRCEESPILAEQANSEIPAALAIGSNQVGARMVHISTDAVFGQRGSHFKETDEPHPTSVYGKTKLQGEKAVMKYASKYLIVRTNFYGYHRTRPTLFNYFYQNLLLERHVSGFTDVFFNPIYVQDLVLGLESFITQDVQGVLHFVGEEVLTKFEFGNKISSQMGIKRELLLTQFFRDLENEGHRKLDLTLSSEVRESFFKCVFDVNSGIRDAILNAKADNNGL